jgi:hypothetical protein
MYLDSREQGKSRSNGRFSLGIIRTIFSRFGKHKIFVKSSFRTIIELIGLSLIVFGAYLIWIPAACFVAGLALVFIAQGIGGE